MFMDAVLQNVYLNVPKTDVRLIKELAEKMGWGMETKENFIKRFIATRPKHIALTDEDILEEVYAVRHGK